MGAVAYRCEKKNWRLEEFVPARRDWTRIAFAERGQLYLSRCRFPDCEEMAEIWVVYEYTPEPGLRDGTERIPFCREHGGHVLGAKLNGGKGVYVR